MSGTLRIAIVGDRFMRAAFFEEALGIVPSLRERMACRQLELAWPDVPFVHGRPGTPTAGLKEFLGDPDEIASFVGDAQLLVNHLAPVTAGLLERCPELELIAVSRGGPVNIDMAAARARGIAVVNTPGRNASAVAEFTVGMILAETRLITLGHRSLSQGVWRGDLYRADTTGDELCNQTVGLIGYGEVGRRVVPLLAPFGCRMLVHDPYVRIRDEHRALGVREVGFEALLAESDIVSLHARVTPETTGFIDAAAFAKMKRGAYFINTARGPMVVYAALHDALASGRLRGAGLETFDREPPPPDAPLLRLPNVTLTPHIAGASLQTVKVAAAMVAEELRRHVAGEPPVNPC